MSSNGLNTNLGIDDYRRNAYYRSIFDRYDFDHDGFLDLNELIQLVESREYEHDIPVHVIQKIHQLADTNNDNKIDFDEFVEMINHPKLQHIFGHYINRYIHMMIPRRKDPTTTVPDGLYEEEYSCYPPAVGMIILSLVEIIFFCVDEAIKPDSSRNASGPVATLFIYDPRKRKEAWRFLTYMFVHAGPFHLFVNLLVQILLGIPLEMVHKWWRVLIIYACGVLAGSLITSVLDPDVRLVGASGGVYSLITAHIATIIMNWNEMTYPLVQLFIFVVVIGSDVSTAIYNRYYLDKDENIAYMAHFAGALAGLLVGLNILRNLEITFTEKIIWWVSMITFIMLIGVAIVLNIAWSSHFKPEVV